jgi:hypothetical protein
METMIRSETIVSDDEKSDVHNEKASQRLTLGICMGEKAEATAKEAAVRRI